MSDEQQWTGKVEQWGIFELSLEGPEDANPFLDVRLSARFRHGNRVVEPDGFYDGGGTYRVRFMPDTLGAWSFETRSNRDELDGVTGEFVCTEPSPDNHGPVRVHDKHHFSYADGTPHVPVGTTCYVWTHQGDELEEETLNTLRHAPFNKLRMCVFPKHYAYNENEPPAYPFERAEGGGWDFERFDPGFFRRLEGRVGDLMELGTEADVILFHPYDRWGFATMPAEVDDRYLRYIVARLGAYRNVWWSMANEYDLMREKSTADWDRFFRVVQESDPYQHLRSVHNWHEFYDHGKPWVTHQSIQHSDLGKTDEWRELYRKPVVVDECCYEGNIAQHWGNISAREMVHRFWEGTVRGGYVGHGETYTHPEDVLWWSKGGVLHGQSPERIAFLRKVLDRSPVEGLDPLAPPTSTSAERYPCGGKENDYYLFYFGRHQPAALTLALPEGSRYRGEIVDTWGMETTPIREVMEGKCTVELPGRPYFALQVSRLQEDGSDSESGVDVS
jgi:hypothetical protein